ncbi:Uncharacterised protein [Mycobacteroides abscessus subsp. abscessus]|nr:Uncharacterised protein [Mycobacteroides abscessus subsp. abscessus]
MMELSVDWVSAVEARPRVNPLAVKASSTAAANPSRDVALTTLSTTGVDSAGGGDAAAALRASGTGSEEKRSWTICRIVGRSTILTSEPLESAPKSEMGNV